MKRLKQTLMMLFIVFLFSANITYAAENKTIEVNLPKEYISATFSIEFDRNVEGISVIVINPDGVEYEAKAINKNSMQCIVNSVKKGRWKIYINATDGSIGIVDVKVEGSQSQTITSDENIKVATDITGLKIYMHDDMLVVEWADNSCGAVNIQISDAITLQVLESATVKKNEQCRYEYKVDVKESDLLVTVVPATSSNIAGAAKSFSINTNNDPSVAVVFENRKETNENIFNVKVTIEDEYKIIYYANNILVNESGFLVPGEYSYDLPVMAGSNDYKVYIEDKKGYLKSFTQSCVGDFIAPKLILSNLSQDIVTSEDIYRVEGTVENYQTLTVNGKAVVNIYDDNMFWYDYQLHEGDNVIEIVAVDEAGNETKVKRVITYTIKDNSKMYIIGISIFLLFAVVCICVWKIKTLNPDVEVTKTEKKSKEPKKTQKKEKTRIEKSKPEKSSNVHMKYQWLIKLGCVMCSILLLLKFMILVVVISSDSMEPCMKKGDIAIFNRLAYVLDDVQRGDVICYWSDEENKYLGKRIIGMPGDKIKFVDGYVVLNGDFMDESMYIDENVETNCNKEFEVPSDCYFVLGDNREISYDSRFFEKPYIAKDDIKGKYMGFSGINIK